jgi:hypothetical protein
MSWGFEGEAPIFKEEAQADDETGDRYSLSWAGCAFANPVAPGFEAAGKNADLLTISAPVLAGFCPSFS